MASSIVPSGTLLVVEPATHTPPPPRLLHRSSEALLSRIRRVRRFWLPAAVGVPDRQQPPPQQQQQQQEEEEEEEEEVGAGEGEADISLARSAGIVAILSSVMVVGSMSTGAVTISMPRIQTDLGLPDSLLLWPSSVYPLAAGCTLILAGSLADYLGNRPLFVAGCLGLSASTLAVALARTGLEMIAFRALQGVAMSLCLPTAFSILTSSHRPGRRRNIGFACLGLGQPMGYSLGLVVGGALDDVPGSGGGGALAQGWRVMFYLIAALTGLLSGMAVWKLPKDRPRERFSWRGLAGGIDWLGVVLISASLGASSYAFAMVTADISSIRDATNIALLCVSLALAAFFVWWMHVQEKAGRTPLIPNSLWKKPAFSAICVMVLASFAVVNGVENFQSLFFQKVQGLPPIQAAIRFLPNVITGVVLNFVTGLLAHRLRADYLVIGTTFLSAASPLLMAIIQVQWSFWTCAFWATMIIPLSAGVIFTIANLIIADTFSPSTQALAGAVFNTVAQFGNSLGLMVMAVISSGVTRESDYPDKASPEALMAGYRATFWALFALMLGAVLVGMLGLRKVGKVGLKRE